VTTPNVGDDSIDSDFDFSPCSYGVSVSGGQVVKRDLGLAGSITTATGEIELTRVFVDYDDDGLSFGVSNVPGVTFELYSDQDGRFIQSAGSTRFSFNTIFTDVQVGQYFICAFRDVIVDGVPVTLPVEATIANAGDGDPRKESSDSDFITMADGRVCTETITVTSDEPAAVGLGLSSTIVGPILVDQFCTLEDALRSAGWAIPIGFCPSGMRTSFSQTSGTIFLQEGSQHGIFNAIVSGVGQESSTIVKGQGQGAFVDSVSAHGSLINDNNPSLAIFNLTVNIASARFTRLSINSSTVNTAKVVGTRLFIVDSTVLEDLDVDITSIYGTSIRIQNSTICGVFVESLNFHSSTNATNNPCVSTNSSN
jgi:hypothetical protein